MLLSVAIAIDYTIVCCRLPSTLFGIDQALFYSLTLRNYNHMSYSIEFKIINAACDTTVFRCDFSVLVYRDL